MRHRLSVLTVPLAAALAGATATVAMGAVPAPTAGRAPMSGGYTYAKGSDQNLGLWNVYTTSTIKETSPGYWVTC
jgi:hypothetical protein